MKNLFLLFALVFSMGAFAQKVEPISNVRHCVFGILIVEKGDNCLLKPGNYSIEICQPFYNPELTTNWTEYVKSIACSTGEFPKGVHVNRYSPPFDFTFEEVNKK